MEEKHGKTTDPFRVNQVQQQRPQLCGRRQPARGTSSQSLLGGERPHGLTTATNKRRIRKSPSPLTTTTTAIAKLTVTPVQDENTLDVGVLAPLKACKSGLLLAPIGQAAAAKGSSHRPSKRGKNSMMAIIGNHVKDLTLNELASRFKIQIIDFFVFFSRKTWDKLPFLLQAWSTKGQRVPKSCDANFCQKALPQIWSSPEQVCFRVFS